MVQLEVDLIPVLSDNYMYLLHEPREGVTAIVDPAVAGPVLTALKERGRFDLSGEVSQAAQERDDWPFTTRLRAARDPADRRRR